MTDHPITDIQALVRALRSWWPWVRWAARRRLARIDLARVATRPALGPLLAASADARLRAVIAPALLHCLRMASSGGSPLEETEAAALRQVLVRASPPREPALVTELLRAVEHLQDIGAIPAVAEVIEKTTFRGDDLAQYAAAPPWPPRVAAAREPANPELARQLRAVNAAASRVLARLDQVAKARSATDPLLRPASAPLPETLLRPARPADVDPATLLRPAEGDDQ